MLTSFWLFVTTYPPPLTFSTLWTLTKFDIFWPPTPLRWHFLHCECWQKSCKWRNHFESNLTLFTLIKNRCIFHHVNLVSTDECVLRIICMYQSVETKHIIQNTNYIFAGIFLVFSILGYVYYKKSTAVPQIRYLPNEFDFCL